LGELRLRRLRRLASLFGREDLRADLLLAVLKAAQDLRPRDFRQHREHDQEHHDRADKLDRAQPHRPAGSRRVMAMARFGSHRHTRHKQHRHQCKSRKKLHHERPQKVGPTRGRNRWCSSDQAPAPKRGGLCDPISR